MFNEDDGPVYCGRKRGDAASELDTKNRRQIIHNALWLGGMSPVDSNVTIILNDIIERHGERRTNEAIVTELSEQNLRDILKRKLDDENREAFANELTERVWATVKGMTWFTDEQKVIPHDLVERIERKQDEQETELQNLRDNLRG